MNTFSIWWPLSNLVEYPAPKSANFVSRVSLLRWQDKQRSRVDVSPNRSEQYLGRGLLYFPASLFTFLVHPPAPLVYVASVITGLNK